MRGMLWSAILLIIAAAMMGCTDSIMPCADDAECQLDWGWGGDSQAAWDWQGPSMVCNMEVSPLARCEEMMSYLPPLDWLLDWLPIGDWIVIPDCTELYDLPEYDGMGTCESTWGWW